MGKKVVMYGVRKEVKVCKRRDSDREREIQETLARDDRSAPVMLSAFLRVPGHRTAKSR